MSFTLHPRLAGDTWPVCGLGLCEVRLMDDRRFPWLILVPRIEAATELHRIPLEAQQQLLAESSRAASLLLQVTEAEKINLGALGNLVPQLHWHVVARSRDDACWPGPVWGCGEREGYPEAERETLIRTLQEALGHE
ncbi:MAG: HIT family protein [Sedimenticola sp.]|nr:HIT family protein [Sedimenticola sp.]